MSRPRERESGMGLLSRMEARPWRDGKTVSYRYHPAMGNPIALGTDRGKALQTVLDMLSRAPDAGTVNELWRLYSLGGDFANLAPGTRRSYTELSKPLLKVFGPAKAAAIRPADCHRYLRVERKDAPVTANREMALLSNLMNLAVEQGMIPANPCKQIRRNTERPRSEAPETSDLTAFSAWMVRQGGQRKIIARMAQFAAFGGSRRTEFLRLTWQQVDFDAGVIRLLRAKQREREIWDRVSMGESMLQLLTAMLAERGESVFVFHNRSGNPYTEAGFKAMWSKLMAEALAAKAVSRRFTFHDLRAYYATTHKQNTGALPELHSNPAITARVYDRRKEVGRDAL